MRLRDIPIADPPKEGIRLGTNQRREPNPLQRLAQEVYDVNKGRGTPRNLPVMGICRTMLTINKQLLRELSGVKGVRLVIEDGAPVLVPDADGYAIIRDKRPVASTAWIGGPAPVKQANEALPVGSRWVMTRDPYRKRWVGTLWTEDAEEAEYVTIKRADLEELQRRALVG